MQFIVKLHSNLQTQLNFSWFELELTLFSYGRKKEEEPSPSFEQKDCLNFGECLVGVWRVCGNYLVGVRQVSGGCLIGIWRVS